MIQCLSKVIIRPLRPLIRLMDPIVRTSADAGTDIARLATNEASPNERGYFTLLKKENSSPESTNGTSKCLMIFNAVATFCVVLG